MGMQDKIFRVIVPEEEETESKTVRENFNEKGVSWLCFNRDDHDR